LNINGELKMILQNRPKDRNTMRDIGLVCLILAGLSRLFLHPTVSFVQDLVDGTTGLLYGISIGCLLLSLRRSDRQCSREEA
jgi:hypothetical protein